MANVEGQADHQICRVHRTPGDFWQACGRCGKRAQANLTVAGQLVLCIKCARATWQLFLPEPDRSERDEWARAGKNDWPPLTVKISRA